MKRIFRWALCLACGVAGFSLALPPAEAGSPVTREFSSVATPWRKAELAFPVAGIVEEIWVEEGATVSRDAPLLQLSLRLERIALEKAGIEVADASLRAEYFSLKAQRYLRMREEDLVSEEAYEEMRLQAALAGSAKAMAEVEVRRRRAEKEQRILVAPMDGYVLRIMPTEGETVRAGDAVVEMVDLSRLKAAFYLPSEYLGKWSRGDRLQVIPDAPSPDAASGAPEVEGEVSSVDAFVDPSTGRFRMVLEFSPEKVEIRAGQGVRIQL